MAASGPVSQAISELLTCYHDLNPAYVTELNKEPSPLEFMRFAARNVPFVVRQAASSWKACKHWDSRYLRDKLSCQRVCVAVTPSGNADAPVQSTGRTELLMAKPLEEEHPFGCFLAYSMEQEKHQNSTEYAEVRYAQTQNDNLRGEYLDLFADAQRDIPFVRIALQKDPEAVNLWIGNSRSVTALHKDNFENIYVQIKGRKHFVLMPPLAHPCVNEQLLTPATYTRHNDALSLVEDANFEKVPFAIWDPDRPDENATDYSPLARPIRVTLDPGDMLYLPSMWYHKVSQSCISGEEPLVVAINYWYDMDFSGPHYAFTQFERDIVQSLAKE